MDYINRVLFVAPHADDCEFGCGGTIAKFIEEKKEIYYVAFSICEKSVPSCFPKNILAEELKKSANCLGISSNNLLIYNYPVRDFDKYRQDILEELIKLKKELDPQLIFIPSSYDIHQDHEVINKEGIRAFKYQNVLGYEVPWNNFNFSTKFFIHHKYEHLQKKIEAINQYISQKNRDYAGLEYIESLSRIRGIQAGTNYSECFEHIKWHIT